MKILALITIKANNNVIISIANTKINLFKPNYKIVQVYLALYLRLAYNYYTIYYNIKNNLII